MSMLKKCLRWIRTHPKTCIGLGLATLCLLANLMAFVHAHAMTHFVPAGSRTPSPEDLSRMQKVKVLLTGVRVPKPVNEQTPAGFGLTFQTHRIGGPNELEYEAWHLPRHEAKGMVVCFHGYAACKAEMLPEAVAIREMGYEVLLVDLRGCGGSSGTVTTIGYREADDVQAAVEYARARFAPRAVIVYARSMGSAAVLRAVACNGIELDAAVLECPFDRLLSTAKNRFAAMGIPSFPWAQLLVFWGGVQHGYSGFRHDPAEYAKSVLCPVLMLHGAGDPRVTEDQAKSVLQNLAGEKEFVLFDGAGHADYLAADPERWKQAVASFLDSNSASNEEEETGWPHRL